ncbi:acyclic terpene utilization AtuA family protein [Angelakisella massiliensis]|uniref:acyclic terpene utilization AtuA family protein n=1 Tax=Angelakisella massiliensis TaxID=1871018 RepID=UPI0008F8ACDF|nr:acyclic terpene utilization AtuA family protein [Angelakisella massiliensis]
MKELKILSPCGILGYGYPESSFLAGMEHHPDAIVVDAGSTDAGPHKLGAGVAIVSRQACKKDLEIMILNGLRAGIPVVIGSAGGSGGRVHVEWTWSIIREILQENGYEDKKVAVVWGDIPKEVVAQRLAEGKVTPLGMAVPELTAERLERTTAVVAQMGHEPIVKALETGADIILCGRAYDPSPFAAVAAFHGFNLAYGYHAGKILECAALCAEPGTTKDCMLGTIREDGFVVTPLSSERRCTCTSVAAHTFYEKDHPYLLHGPGIVLDLEQCTFTQMEDGRSVFVTGSRIHTTDPYYIKLEGAMQVAYRTFVVAGIRDPLLIGRLEEVEALVEKQVRNYYKELPQDSFRIHFLNYGIDGVMGKLEPRRDDLPHEVGVVFEVLADSQERANAICATVRSTFLHYGYEGRKSTAGNLAFPFAPSDVPFGPVYEFSVYHLMEVRDGCEMFPLEMRTGGDKE